MRRWIGLLLVVGGVLLAALSPVTTSAQGETVYVAQIDKEIDLGLAAYLRRVLDEAEAEDAAAVILEINTPGGRLDAALQMRDAILDADVPTIAFVNREAFSAGALIALAADTIYLTPGAVIGAATPVTGTGETADEKIVSAVRKTFKSTAELRDRNPRVAEAMVDPDVEIEGLVEEGELLTLTTDEALEWGYADGVAEDLEDLLDETGLEDAEVNVTSVALAERIVRFLTNPVVASLLMSLGTLIILADLYTGGFGALALVGIGLIAAFFWGHFLAGLAGWEGIALVVIGLILLAVEAFLVPGFGIAGIPGVVALLAGIYLSLIGDEFVTREDIERAGLTVALTFFFLVAGGAAILALLPQAARFRALVLQSTVGDPDPPPPAKRRRRHEPEQAPVLADDEVQRVSPPSLAGQRGVALTDLRPGGIAEVAGDRLDVVTRGDYIPAGAAIEIVRDEGYRRIVRRVEPDVIEEREPAD